MVATAGTSGQALFRVNGCISSVQPNGVAQRSQYVPGPESASMRSTKATANTLTRQARRPPASAAEL